MSLGLCRLFYNLTIAYPRVLLASAATKLAEGRVSPESQKPEYSGESPKEPEGEFSPENVTKTEDAPPVTESKPAADLEAETAAVKAAECGCIIL